MGSKGVFDVNRAIRRKQIAAVANDVLKARARSQAKKHYGIGVVLTTQMISFMFWSWVWVPWDRRAK